MARSPLALTSSQHRTARMAQHSTAQHNHCGAKLWFGGRREARTKLYSTIYARSHEYECMSAWSLGSKG